MTVAIRAVGLTKDYRLGRTATSAKEALAGFLKPIRSNRTSRETVRALGPLDLEIQQGEVVGVVGPNGSGKSTFLKILSRVTTPTSGRVEVTGRVGSLLEVGTGFHPELTGEENIWLNGAILGLTRAEVATRYDDIVEFAGVERFLQTPVKRYSSGMTVRLGFAVAAHLEPDILLIDEVLSVGDAAFRQRCLGKMQDVAGAGRTVVFVSHNLSAVTALCQRAIWLEGAVPRQDGDPAEVIADYLDDAFPSATEVEYEPVPDDRVAALTSVRLLDEHGRPSIDFGGDSLPVVEVSFEVRQPTSDLNVGCIISTASDQRIVTITDADGGGPGTKSREQGRYIARVTLPIEPFRPGSYRIALRLGMAGNQLVEKRAGATFRYHGSNKYADLYAGPKGPDLIAARSEWIYVRTPSTRSR